MANASARMLLQVCNHTGHAAWLEKRLGGLQTLDPLPTLTLPSSCSTHAPAHHSLIHLGHVGRQLTAPHTLHTCMTATPRRTSLSLLAAMQALSRTHLRLPWCAGDSSTPCDPSSWVSQGGSCTSACTYTGSPSSSWAKGASCVMACLCGVTKWGEEGTSNEVYRWGGHTGKAAPNRQARAGWASQAQQARLARI